MPRTQGEGAAAGKSAAAAGTSRLKSRSWDWALLFGPAGDAAALEIREQPKLRPVVGEHPRDQGEDDDRGQHVGCDDESGVRPQIQVTPLARPEPASGAKPAPGAAGSRCAWPPPAG